MRASTESLLTQLEHLWALRRAVTRLAAGSVLESADELGRHLDEIRRATTNCSEIAGAAGKARDHSLRFILRCHQGETSDHLRSEALRSINDLEDEILRFRVVDEETIAVAVPLTENVLPDKAYGAAYFADPMNWSYALKGDPFGRVPGHGRFSNAHTFSAMP